MSTDLSADKKVGARIRYFREQQGIKQKELAQDIHVSPSFLNRIEKGTVRLTLDYICSICDVLNINPRDVLCDIWFAIQMQLRTSRTKSHFLSKAFHLQNSRRF